MIANNRKLGTVQLDFVKRENDQWVKLSKEEERQAITDYFLSIVRKDLGQDAFELFMQHYENDQQMIRLRNEKNEIR